MKRLLISTSFTVVVVTAIFLLMTQLIQKDASVLTVTDMPTLVTRLIKEVPETKKIRRIPPKKKIVKKQPEQLHDKPETVTETKLTQAVDISYKNAWVTNSTSFYNQAGNADEVLTPVVSFITPKGWQRILSAFRQFRHARKRLKKSLKLEQEIYWRFSHFARTQHISLDEAMKKLLDYFEG